MPQLIAMVERLLSVVGTLLGIVDQKASQLTANSILEAVHNIFFELTDATYGLSAIMDKLLDIESHMYTGSPPTTGDISYAVWNYQYGLMIAKARELLQYTYTDSHGLAVMRAQSQRFGPYIEYQAYSDGEFDIYGKHGMPNLDSSLILPGDTLLDWLQRCTPTLTWTKDTWYNRDFYHAPASPYPGFYWGCILTEAEFASVKQGMFGPPAMEETLIASDITGDYTDTGGYKEYRLHLVDVPTWAGYRVGTPNLYEVNSRMEQLGWAMFGDGNGWETWQLLVWQDQILTTRLASPTSLHITLRAGVSADLYGRIAP